MNTPDNTFVECVTRCTKYQNSQKNFSCGTLYFGRGLINHFENLNCTCTKSCILTGFIGEVILSLRNFFSICSLKKASSNYLLTQAIGMCRRVSNLYTDSYENISVWMCYIKIAYSISSEISERGHKKQTGMFKSTKYQNQAYTYLLNTK